MLTIFSDLRRNPRRSEDLPRGCHPRCGHIHWACQESVNSHSHPFWTMLILSQERQLPPSMLSTPSSAKDALCMVSAVRRYWVFWNVWWISFLALWAESLAVLRGLGFLLFKVFIVSYGYGGIHGWEIHEMIINHTLQYHDLKFSLHYNSCILLFLLIYFL
jgi:hypothetical protein